MFLEPETAWLRRWGGVSLEVDAAEPWSRRTWNDSELVGWVGSSLRDFARGVVEPVAVEEAPKPEISQPAPEIVVVKLVPELVEIAQTPVELAPEAEPVEPKLELPVIAQTPELILAPSLVHPARDEETECSSELQALDLRAPAGAFFGSLAWNGASQPPMIRLLARPAATLPVVISGEAGEFFAAVPWRARALPVDPLMQPSIGPVKGGLAGLLAVATRSAMVAAARHKSERRAEPHTAGHFFQSLNWSQRNGGDHGEH